MLWLMLGSATELRYVVLHHTGYGEEHYDLMIEPSPGAATLLTWRVAHWPLRDGAPVTPLGEHRRDYLEYEGPVSGGRGEVRRIARGMCAIWSEERATTRVRFEEGDEWVLGADAHRA